MRPPKLPPFAWIHAAEAAATASSPRDFWSWTRRERTTVLLAALDGVPSEFSATESELPLDAHREAWEAAFTAAGEVVRERKRRRRNHGAAS